jgi:GT2 family glycosyltransferase
MTAGKFLQHRGAPLLVKGVSYGTFAPDLEGWQFPARAQVRRDFALMAEHGINTVRLYTPPPMWLLDEAAGQGLCAMIGLPWPQHFALLDDRSASRRIRKTIDEEVRRLAPHDAVLLFAIGNEVPASIVRWHGRERVERFLGDLYGSAKSAAPDRMVTYVNYPPTDYLALPFLDVVAFNVYLHDERALRGYIARLQHIAGSRPLLLAEAGADAFREGEDGQAVLTAMQLHAAFEEGACGAVAFTWTDEWWRGGHDVEDWAFGLVDRDRRPKPALYAAARVFAVAPFAPAAQRTWPRVSVVVCVYNGAATLADCLDALAKVDYPDVDVIVVDDGSTDGSREIAARYPWVTLVAKGNGGLSSARNAGLSAASGKIVAYLDADARPDPTWLSYLVQPFLTSDVAGVGGPSVVPHDDPWFAQCVARAPGSPSHVLLNDRLAEHVPGCNMAFRREVLLALDGFNPLFLRAGDDVDFCWRVQARGWEIGFAPGALVWHHHRTSLRAYWRQQVGYGESETWLRPLHPEKFAGLRTVWHGHIYSPLPSLRALRRSIVNTGVWGTAAFPSVYRTAAHPLSHLPHSARWQVTSLALALIGLALLSTPMRTLGAVLLAAGAAGVAVTVVKCAWYALDTDVERLSAGRRSPRVLRRVAYRTALAMLHFVQPLARAYGRVRGYLVRPQKARPAFRHATDTPQGMPAPGRAMQLARLTRSGTLQACFWSERYVDVQTVLTKLADWLRLSRAVDLIEIDEGWWSDRDLSVAVGHLLWLDVRALVEDHGGGRSRLRVAMRPRLNRVGSFMAGALLIGAAVAIFQALAGSGAASAVAALCGAVVVLTAWRLVRTAGTVYDALDKVTAEMRMTPMGARSRAPRAAPSTEAAVIE